MFIVISLQFEPKLSNDQLRNFNVKIDKFQLFKMLSPSAGAVRDRVSKGKKNWSDGVYTNNDFFPFFRH